MNLTRRIESIAKLHEVLKGFYKQELQGIAYLSEQGNPWFTEDNFFSAFNGLIKLIEPKALKEFQEKYQNVKDSDKKLGLILAGNLPGVGFHDMVIGLLSGCELYIKLSSEDKVLIPFIVKELAKIDADLAAKCHFVERLVLDELDAVIATGSDNTARYFEQYFSKKPNLIRKSRTSVAVLTGEETEEELKLLADDIISYYGLGCRNVSKILLLGDADIIPLLQVLEHRKELNNFSKYDNNYLYYKSIYLVNREPFLDTETMLFRETTDLHSPISVLFYQRFEDRNGIEKYLTANLEKLQCVVGKNEAIAFGQAQKPSLLDYADSVDVRLFIDGVSA